jgi:hypothetical protein
LLGLGVAAACTLAAGAWVGFGPVGVRRVVGAAAVAFAVYAAAVLGGAQRFIVPIVSYCAASAWLLCRLAARFARTRERGALAAGAGLVGIVVGAAMQQAGVALPRAHLDHNALFHVVQGAALALLFAGARRLTRRDPCSLDDASS